MTKFVIKDSKIHGKGVFAKKNLKKNEIIGLGIRFVLGFIPYITDDFGSLINHCEQSNTKLIWFYANDEELKGMKNPETGWYIMASKPVKNGEELLLNYSNTPFYIQGPLSHYKC
jgi:SET domain-containing protein